MLHWKLKIPAPPPQKWQSRAEILKAHLDSLSPDELLRVRPIYYWLRFGQQAWMREQARKANFSPDQPRWPAGSGRISGRWSGGSGGGAQVINNAQTGISTIDNTTDDLLETLKNVVDFLPSGSGSIYGIAVHTIFGTLVRFGNFPGIGFGDVETTFGGSGRYGSTDSIRTDVILRNEIGDPIAIYDVKTGDARLRPSRIKELRDKVGAGPRIPVIEMHVTRGVAVKGRSRGESVIAAHCQSVFRYGEF